MRKEPPKEGYHIFWEIVNEDNGFEKAAGFLEAQVHKAEEQFDITFLGGPKFEPDAGGNARNIYFAYQGAILKRKKGA